MKEMKNQYALVTGASQGLGREIARELASRGYNLLLTALPNENLQLFSVYLKEEYHVEVKYFEADLTKIKSVKSLAQWAVNFPIEVLVNNAGFGGSMPFDRAKPEYINSMIQLNVMAPSLLIRLILPSLQNQDKSYILNVSSMAAFSPMAYKTVYPASKAFIWSFSRGLYQELKPKGIFVGVIHPGPIRTNPEVSGRIDRQKFFGRIGLVEPDKLARIAMRQLFNRDSLLIPGFMNKINWVLMKIIPLWIRLGLLARVIKREFKPQNINDIQLEISAIKDNDGKFNKKEYLKQAF